MNPQLTTLPESIIPFKAISKCMLKLISFHENIEAVHLEGESKNIDTYDEDIDRLYRSTNIQTMRFQLTD